MRTRSITSGLWLVGFVLVLLFTGVGVDSPPGVLAGVAGQASIPGDGTKTFPETGKTVTGLFLDYWNGNGGLAQQGYPISETMQEKSELDGKTYAVQYFERAVFEHHPENQLPYDVLLSQLGTFAYKDRYPQGEPVGGSLMLPASAGQTEGKLDIVIPVSEDCRVFEQTGKPVCGEFLRYWQEHGGLAQQGYPISGEFSEKSALDGKTYTVQYFERAVFEKHPENQSPYDVLLSQLGTFAYKDRYGSAQPTPTTTAGAYAGPTARAGHELVYDDARKVVLMLNAGDVAGDAEGSQTKLWAWDGKAWKLLSSSGPPTRSLGGVAFDSRRGVLVIHGGVTNNFNYDDTWEWDGSKWTEKTSMPSPGFRHHFSMAYDVERGVIVAYGGNLQADETAQSQLTFPTDTWTWDGQTWKQVATTGFGTRYHYAMTYDSALKRALIFGGATRAASKNDLWSWDGAKWVELVASGARPSARSSPAMAYDEQTGKTILFGGRVGSSVLGDTWEWDGTKWAQLQPAGANPPARSHHAMTYDKARGKIVMFGGIVAGADDNYIADTWEFDGATWAKMAGP